MNVDAARAWTPIGVLRTPFRSRADCPRNGHQGQPPLCRATLFEAFRPGLQGIDGFSHLIVLYWLHQAPPAELVITPPFHDAPVGVFATRAPARPTPTAACGCAIWIAWTGPRCWT